MQEVRVKALWLAGLVAVAGCAQAATPTAAPTLTPVVPAATATVAAATRTPLPTSTDTPMPTATIQPTVTPLPTAVVMVRECLSLSPAFVQGGAPEGQLVLSSGDWFEDVWLYTPASGEQRPLTEDAQSFSGVFVSPSGQWVAFLQGAASGSGVELVVADATGQPQWTWPWPAEWRQLAGWLDDDRLLISRPRSDEPYALSDDLITFEIASGVETPLPADFQGFVNTDYYPGSGWETLDWSRLIFNAALERVAFPGEAGSLVLWDVTANRPITRLAAAESVRVQPRWAPDDQRLVYAGPAARAYPQQGETYYQDELFQVTADGAVTRLTHLNEGYTEVSFSRFGWSPDGRYIAAAVVALPNQDPGLYPAPYSPDDFRLIVLDTQTLVLVDYCIPANPLYAPVWSPDGRYIAVEDRIGDDAPSHLYIVDVTQGVAVEVLTGYSLLGWLAAPP